MSADRTSRPRIERVRRAACEQLGLAESRLRLVVSPYRVCPLGAHIDHQGGPVLGLAIDEGSVLAFAPSQDESCTVLSLDFEGPLKLSLSSVAAAREGGWGDYLRAAVWALRERLPARPRGLVGALHGSFPGSGLSSSASVLLAYLSALAQVNEIELGEAELVALSRRAENDFVGVASGILDPASIVGARRDELLAIDTRACRWESIPSPSEAPETRLLLAYSGVSRNLAATGFNDRVGECREAARRLAERAGRAGVERLGDLPPAELEDLLEELPDPWRRRARHFAGERARVERGIECWRAGELGAFGALMFESCRSSIESYETGAPQLVELQQILTETPGVLGARFSGGGYGGCAVALVAAAEADRARASVEAEYRARRPEARSARVVIVASDDGLRLS